MSQKNGRSNIYLEAFCTLYEVNGLWSPDLGCVYKVGTNECKIQGSTNRDGLDFDRRPSNISEGFIGLGTLVKDLFGP